MNERLLSLDLRDDASSLPKRERLKDYFVGEIAAGRLRPGQMLPSDRVLGKTLGIARMTVSQAMSSLESDGFIRRVPGKGTFVEDSARRKLQRGIDLFALIVLETHRGFYPSLLHGFEAAAGDIHHQAIVCATDDNVERQAHVILQLIDKKVGGVALNPTQTKPTPAHQVRLLQEQGIPVVFCHRRVEGVEAPLLALPYRSVGKMACEILAEHGHRRMMFFSSLPVLGQQFEDGFREAAQAIGGVTVQFEYCFDDATLLVSEEACWRALQEAFAKPDPPTAIFTTFDSIAELIYLLLLRMGLRVPDDVSLLGFGGALRDGAFARRLTSIVIDEVATGQKAVAILHEMRSGERAIDDHEEFILEPSLYGGETLAVAMPRPAKPNSQKGGSELLN